MATTPIYAIPTPDLGQTADGPAATSAMALRIEAVMTKFLTETAYENTTQVDVNAGATTVVHQVNLSSNFIGWLHVMLGPISLGDPGGGGTAGIAGFVQILVNDTIKRQVRYHNQGRAALWSLGGVDTAIALSGSASTNVKVRVSVDGVSFPVRYFSSNLALRQFGTT